MKRTSLVVMGVLLVAASMAQPAMAKKKKKPPAPTPIPVTLFGHGSAPLGEIDHNQDIAAPQYLKLDATASSGSTSKSIGFAANGQGNPNDECAANPLFPVFMGPYTGRVTGDIKLTFNVISTPGTVDVRVWPDVASSLCNSMGTNEYVDPARSLEVDLSGGPETVEVILSGVDFESVALLTFQITPISAVLGRVMYDSSAEEMQVELTCLPPAGATACV